MVEKKEIKEALEALEDIFEDLNIAKKEKTLDGEFFDGVSQDDERFDKVRTILYSLLDEKEKKNKPFKTIDFSTLKNARERLIKITSAKEQGYNIKAKNYEHIHDDYELMESPYDQYRVSKDGTHVINTYNDIIKMPSANSDNYRKFYLFNNFTKEMEQVYAHQVVARTYLSCSKQGFEEVDHIDRDRSNNDYENLRWVSRSDNLKNRRF